MDNALSGLTYKELQVLAQRYRVPGNIKKHLLVKVLEAIQRGDEDEVDRILNEVQQTRKKRIKKQKPNGIMNAACSTPLHSPIYAISEADFYPRHQQPCQWVGAEEEISVRDEESMRVPNYADIHQFFLSRIQRREPHQTYNFGSRETSQASGVDLRTVAGASVLRPIMIETTNIQKSNVIIDRSYLRVSSELEMNILENASDNINSGPILLKKMLEAPVGANLGEIASPDASSNKYWPVDEYGNRDPAEGSETLTAYSEIDIDDSWTTNNANNNNSNYYCPVEESKNEFYENKPGSAFPSENPQYAQVHDISDDGPNNNCPESAIINNNYQLGCLDVQSSCQKWIASSSFINREATGYPETQMVDNSSRCYANPIYYEQDSGNSTVTRAINNRDRQYQHYPADNMNYEAIQGTLQQRSNLGINVSHNYQQNNHTPSAQPNHNGEIYYSQNIQKEGITDVQQEYFRNYDYHMQAMNNSCQSAVMQSAQSSAHLSTSNEYGKDRAFQQQDCNTPMQYTNNPYFSQYHQENNQSIGAFSATENNQHQQTNVVAQEANNAPKNAERASVLRPVSNGILDTYLPRWPMNATLTPQGQLEAILNLCNRESIDYSKENETSSVYCYAQPVVTQRIETTHSPSPSSKPPVAENRQHFFTPYCLVYNDASTGMIMSNIGESAEECPGDDTLGECEAFERGASTDSSENSINDVWIHDYTNYPISSDTTLQNIDPSNHHGNNHANSSSSSSSTSAEDDLFSSVRTENAQDTIDDHSIEFIPSTFENIHY